MSIRILRGDCRDTLKTLEPDSVDCVVTSPPYWGLRDYGVSGQIGLEESPELYVEKMVEVFREIRRVLRSDGTAWLNLGDSYSGSGKGGNPDPSSSKQATNVGSQTIGTLYGKVGETARMAAVTNVTRRLCAEQGWAPKQLIGIPWRVAFALQADGWWLRQDIIWSKPNPMPESVTDRCTRAHEYIFLLSKSARYHFDAAAIAEPATYSGLPGQDASGFKSAGMFNGKHAETDYRTSKRKSRDNFKREGSKRAETFPGQSVGTHRPERPDSKYDLATRNKRDVWEVATKPYSEAHFATFPPELIEPCILAGCPKGGTVLDPFGGAGTTGLVADRLSRNAIMIELNPEYISLASKRIERDGGMFAEVQTA